MRLREVVRISVVACVAGLFSTAGLSQEKQAQQGQPPEHGQMSEESAAWMKAAQPGPNHKLLDYCVGTWRTTVRHWMSPDVEEPESHGICESKWVLGGRFIETHYRGEFMGDVFEGAGFTGYDNVTRKFVSTWVDTMGTGIMTEEGTYDPAKREFTYVGEAPTPTGGTMKQKIVIKIVDDDQHVMTFHHTYPGQEEMTKVMEITYTRAETGKDKRPE